jgi:outer membrane protein OmpA-like peptidoglycan-associated protein
VTTIARIIAIGVGILIARYGAGWHGMDNWPEKLERAKEQIAERQLSRAKKELQQIVNHTPDRRLKALAQFYRALAVHDELELVRLKGDVSVLDRGRLTLVREWAKFSDLEPHSVVGKNNFAMAQAEAGDVEAAIRTLAVALQDVSNGPDEAFFRRNLGDLYRRAGDWKAAGEQYIEVLKRVPEERDVATRLVDVTVRRNQDGLKPLFARIESDVPAARLTVASAVLQRVDLASADDTDLATIEFARALADDLSTYGYEHARERLAVAGARMPKPAFKELLGLIDDDHALAFAWWTAGDLNRRRAFTRLLAAMGAQASANGDESKAIEYYATAARDADGADPGAVTPLVNSYVARSAKVAELDMIIDSFMGKVAGQLQPSEEAYEFHVSAGMAYLNAKRLRNPIADHAALFHLERAAEIAKVLGRVDKALRLLIGKLESDMKQPARVVLKDGQVLATVLFDFDSETLDCHAVATAAQTLQEDLTAAVTIHGHTDSLGEPAYNEDLGLRRANAVMRCLAEAHVDASRMHADSCGENFPIASNQTTSGRSQNRRAECIVDRSPGRPSTITCDPR